MAIKDLITPLKRKSGSSLTSGGSVETPKQATAEQGSSIAAEIREIVPALGNRPSEIRTYYQMANFHAASRSSLRACKSGVMGGEYYMEPASEEEVDVDIAEFVYYNLFEALSNPWTINLSRITKFCEYGSSIFECVYEQRDWAPKRKGANHKTYTVLRKLGYRPPQTIKEIVYDDNGGPVEIVQTAIRKDKKQEEVRIPIQKAIIFVNDEEGGNLLGKSMLRSAYPHWFYIQHLYKVDAIQKERHGMGVPKAKIPPGIKQADKDATLKMLQNIRANEHAGILEPLGYEFEFMELPGNLVNVLDSIDHHNAMVMLNVLAEFLVAGVSEGGSRATSASQQDIFMKANHGMADIICDSINQYLIPWIVGYNFDTDRFPKLRVTGIGDTRDQQQLASALANLVDKEIITPDMDLEQWARKKFQAPRKTEERPEFSPSQIRKIINESTVINEDSNGISGVGNKGNSSTTRPTGGQGNMGKGNDVS